MSKPLTPSPDAINWLAANINGALTFLAVTIVGALGWLSLRLGITFWESKITIPQAELKEQQKELKEEQKAMNAKLAAQDKELNFLNQSMAVQTVMLQQCLNSQAELKSEFRAKTDEILSLLLKQKNNG